MKYRREIDGLRALAVIPVILFHAGYSLFSGGYVGVDVFFVISGYLITTILVSELKAGKFSVIIFYERRARRILPALFFMMFVTVPVAFALLSPYDLVSFLRSIVAVSLFVSNLFFLKNGGYFETAGELKPLLHTWSLAVEEQYYILFPIFLVVGWKYGIRALISAMCIIAISSLALSQVGSVLLPVPNFFLLPSRAWELAVGSIVAFYLLESEIKLKKLDQQLLSMIGFVAILASIFLYDNETPFPSVYALIPTIGAALIISFASKDTYIGALLGSRLFVLIGATSYSAYLWHQPILAFAKVGMPLLGEISKEVLLLLIFILAILSWKFIETPFRKGALFSGRIISISIGVISIFALLAFYSSKSIGSIANEDIMARHLTENVAIYASNMNERTFIKSRVEVETLSPKVVVLGSSRIMQISSKSIGESLLNLGVSGSSVEDYLAIWTMVARKFNPDIVMIGADPWLFNSMSGQDRWKTLESEYFTGLNEIGVGADNDQAYVESKSKDDNIAINMYRHLNIAKISSNSEAPENLDKILRDGSRVYNLTYANKTSIEVEGGVISFAKYAMSPYEYSLSAQIIFKKLIKSIGESRKVVLVLSPYHPKLYNFMVVEDGNIIDIEANFRKLASDLSVSVIGSYDPAVIGCDGHEFYDGMHPKESCMNKVVGHLK